MTSQTWFGLQPPEQAVSAWGARAIFQADHRGRLTVEYLWDRQQGRGERLDDLDIFLKRIGKIVNEMVIKTGLGPRDSKLVVEEIDGWTVAIDPKASCGYLYIGVWR